MRNIRQPIARILLNSVTADDIGVYGDPNQGRKMLKFKKLGITIPGDTYAAGTTPLTATATLNADLRVSRSETDDGVKKGYLVELEAMAPADDNYWGYGITVQPEVKLYGVRNNRHKAHQTTYGGEIAAITTTAGYVDDTYLLTAEDDIISQITADAGKHHQNPDPISNMSGAVCDAYRAYVITTNNGDNITLTYADGTTDTIAMGATTLLSAHAINNDATAQVEVKAWAISATQIMVRSQEPGDLFTISVAGSNVIDHRYIMLEAKDEEVQFNVEIDPALGSLEGYHRFEITGYTASGGTWYVTVDGDADATGATENTLATFAGNLNTRFAAKAWTNIYASYDTYGGGTAQVIIWSTADNHVIRVVPDATCTGVVAATYSYFAKYPSMTADDIHRIFSNQNKGGKLSAFMYTENAIEDEDYVCYTLVFEGTKISALHGASYDAMHTREVHLYVLKSAIDDDLYDANLPNNQYSYIDTLTGGKTLDTNLEELLQIWAGTAPSTW